jgi:hypothetical protein
MNQTAGHAFRFAGLFLEMVGIWGVYRSYGKVDQPGLHLPGGSTVPWPWAAWGIGFVLWLIGRFILLVSGTSRKRQRDDDATPFSLAESTPQSTTNPVKQARPSAPGSPRASQPAMPEVPNDSAESRLASDAESR